MSVKLEMRTLTMRFTHKSVLAYWTGKSMKLW